MLLKMLVILGAFGSVLLQSSRKWSDFQPALALKAELPVSEQPSLWTQLRELDYEQAGALSAHLKKTLKRNRQSSSYMLAKGDHVISKHSAIGVSMDNMYDFPYGNSLGLLSFGVGILLEGFRPAVIYQPMVDSLKGKDRNNPIFQHKEKSLFDMLTTLPLFDTSVSIENLNDIYNGLDNYGKEAMEYVNIVLGKSKNEAWLDSFYAFGIEEAPLTSSGQLQIRLQHLLSYSLSIMHEFKMSQSAQPMMKLPTVDHHYMFGWWLNCPNSLGTCLCSKLPKDLIMSVTPSLRIYIVPSLELSLIIHSTENPDTSSLKEILEADESVWSEIRTFLENIGGTSDRFQENNLNEFQNSEVESNLEHGSSEDALVQFIHQVWPVLVFVFWVVSSHVWVYWMFHCCWIVATYASKRTHIPRPKTASSN